MWLPFVIMHKENLRVVQMSQRAYYHDLQSVKRVFKSLTLNPKPPKIQLCIWFEVLCSELGKVNYGMLQLGELVDVCF